MKTPIKVKKRTATTQFDLREAEPGTVTFTALALTNNEDAEDFVVQMGLDELEQIYLLIQEFKAKTAAQAE